LYVTVDGVPRPPSECSGPFPLTLHQGESRDFTFEIGKPFHNSWIDLWARGYYVPDAPEKVDIPDTGKAGAYIADMAGNMVFSLITKNTSFNPGRYQVVWNGQSVSGSFAGAGVYIYVFTYTRKATGKVTVIRKPVFLVK
jgi:hypothetical protein